MLNNLTVVNGSMTPRFAQDVLEYTVYVESDVLSLVLDYEVNNTDTVVTVYGNDFLTEGENHVLLEVYDEKVTTYTLSVYKSVKEVNQMENTETKLEVSAQNEFLNDLITPGISVICFIIIVFLFCIIFKKK